jgi:tRNA pseudouridine38-40 synthase
LTLFDPAPSAPPAERGVLDPSARIQPPAPAAHEEPPARTAEEEPNQPSPDRDAVSPHVDAERELLRLRLVVAYDGSGFRGFAAQRGQRTVAGELARAIETVARRPVDLVCAGRTDAGVHALGQVVHVDVPPEVSPERLAKSVNAMLGPTVVVRAAQRAPEGFDARRSARSRRYRYSVLRSDNPNPLLASLSWHVRDRLDVRSMSQAADALIGEHDFSAFCRRPPGAPRAVPIPRRVLDASWSRPRSTLHLGDGEELLCFDISARSFCHQMVRSVVGALVDVGRARRRVADVNWLLHCGDRSHATTIAPPQGLCLLGVEYEDGT